MLKHCRDRGGEVIVINPAKEPGLVKFAVPKSPGSMLAGGTEIASQYIQPRIGSDLFLFKGIARALLEMHFDDAGYIAGHTTGFDAFRRDIEALGWDEIVDGCGIPKAEIERLAMTYGQAQN